jgi:hypothetical protein
MVKTEENCNTLNYNYTFYSTFDSIKTVHFDWLTEMNQFDSGCLLIKQSVLDPI